jgi:molybdate transport system substrate-binding protein
MLLAKRERRVAARQVGGAIAIRLAIAAGLVAGLAAAAGRVGASEPETLRVFAAASLTETVGALAARFDGPRLRPSFGPSSGLARQIADGAPADVFVSASPEWIGFLREKGALRGEPVTFARNALVCIAGRGSPLAARPALDPASLLERLDGADLAIADEGVPAGEYARAALRQLGLLDAYRPHLVGQKDVRAVLHAVESGELPLGFVYATDARIAAVDVLFRLDPGTHPPIEYVAAVVRGTHQPGAAQRFVAFLRSDAAQGVLGAAGFDPPGAP